MTVMDDSDLSRGAILRRFREKKGLSRAELAKSVDAHHNQIQKLENNERKLTIEWIERLAPHLGVTPGQFVAQLPVHVEDEISEDHERPGIVTVGKDDFTAVGRFDASFSMGPGSLVADRPEPLGHWMLETQWLHSISRALPTDLAIVRCSGDSMQGTLFDGDWVLVDMTQRRLSREGLYAIRVGDSAWIKRISLNLRTKQIRVLSDNPSTPAQPEMDEEELSIIGRVIALVARKVS